MDKTFLWFNAAIYFIFSAWCTLQWRSTSAGSGFKELDADGTCEYLTVYGGMELGFAVFYTMAALKEELREAAILFSVLMYTGLVLYRVPAILMFGPVSTTTKIIATLEAVLCVCAWLLKK